MIKVDPNLYAIKIIIQNRSKVEVPFATILTKVPRKIVCFVKIDINRMNSGQTLVVIAITHRQIPVLTIQ